MRAPGLVRISKNTNATVSENKGVLVSDSIQLHEPYVLR